MEYALIEVPDTIRRYEDFADPPQDLAPEKGLLWLPVVVDLPEPGPGQRLVGPVVTVTDDAVTRVWGIEPIPLDEIREAQKAAATERRKVERDRGVVINGNRWQSDKESFDNVASHVNTGRLYEAGQGAGTFQTRWKTVDGFISATLTDLIKAQLTIGLFVQACFAREDALFSAIDAAETAEDILAVSLGEGWPDDGGPKDAATVQAIQQANARLERRAKELEAQGDTTDAQLLRLQIKEI